MPVRPIVPLSSIDRLDFHEFFHDAALVRSTLQNFSTYLPDAICYCLQFHCVPGGRSWFEPYGFSQGYNGLITQSGIELPHKIYYDKLVIPKQQEPDDWPVLAEWTKGADPSNHPPLLENAIHLEALVRGSDQHVGYFKAATPAGRSTPPDNRLKDAYAQAIVWLQSAIRDRRRLQSLLDKRFKEALAGTHVAVSLDLQGRQLHRAIRRVLTLVSSHVVHAPVNRVVCLVPTRYGSLTSVYAHGGDCSEDFSARVQRHLGQEQHSVSDVQHWIDQGAPPTNDPLYDDFVGQPWTIDLGAAGDSVLSRLWAEKGQLDKLPKAMTVTTAAHVQFTWSSWTARVEDPLTVAVKFRADDPAFRDIVRSRPSAPILKNRNGQFFALPWCWNGEILGIVVADMGYWHDPNIEKDVVPRLLMASFLLDEFAPHFWGQKLA